MREIKFRAWDKKNKRMNLGGFWIGALNGLPAIVVGERNGKPVIAIQEHFVLMQFTGLHDKNGKEIYEGDICLAALPEERFPVEVIWCEDIAGFLFQWKDDTYESGKDEMTIDCFRDIEVIGNVHEHKNLLEGG